MKINKSRYAFLGILKYGEMSGYDIKKAIDGSIANFWTEDYGRIYPELKQMEQDGYVTKTPDIKESGPNRNLYKITAKGEMEFDKWLQAACEKQPTRNELLLKIFFGRVELVDNLIQIVTNEKAENEMIIKKYQQIEAALSHEKKTPVENKSSTFWSITLLYGKYKAEGVLKWCDETLELLKVMKEKNHE